MNNINAQMIENLYMLNIIKILLMFIVFLALNLVIFSSIEKGYLGAKLKVYFTYLLETKQRLNIFSFCMFILGLLIFYIINCNVVYLDDKIMVTTTIESTTFQFSGAFIDSIFQNIGSAGVFAAAVRISGALVVKKKMGLLPKTGIIGGTAVGFTAIFKLTNQVLSGGSSGSATIETGPIKIEVDNLKVVNGDGTETVPGNSWYEQTFGSLKIKNNNSISVEKIGETRIINGKVEDSSVVLDELEKINPNWRDTLISSCLEQSDIQFILESLNLHLIINFVTVYLLIMLLIILICKLVLKDNSSFNNLNKYPLGIYANKILSFYVKVWKQSGNIFIFLIVLSLIIFNSVVLISLHQLINILN